MKPKYDVNQIASFIGEYPDSIIEQDQALDTSGFKNLGAGATGAIASKGDQYGQALRQAAEKGAGARKMVKEVQDVIAQAAQALTDPVELNAFAKLLKATVNNDVNKINQQLAKLGHQDVADEFDVTGDGQPTG